MRNIVVTGGGGFIGSAIARRLAFMGERVRVIGRRHYSHLTRLGIHCLRGDIADRPFMEQALAGADLVFHVAAKAGIWGTWSEYERINVRGTVNVIQACRRNNVGVLVYTSTPSVVFQGDDIQGGDEGLAYSKRTLCHYATSKIIAEKLVLAANDPPHLKTTAIRPHLVWGPEDPHLVPRLLARAKANTLQVIGKGNNRVDISHIDNVVHAHLLAADNLMDQGSAAGQAFFIGQQQPVFLWEWINTLLAGCGLPRVKKRVPLVIAYGMGALLECVHAGLGLAGEPRMTRFVALQLGRSHWFSHRKAEEILGYHEQVNINAGMDELFRILRPKEGRLRQ